jgi:glycosyltransferase involved in cell wall biosynthesis
MSKKKILLLSDDLRIPTGIGTMSKEMVLGTIDKYDWLQLGAGINHVEHGKYVDCSLDAQQRTGVKDADLKIIPYNGYGDIGMIRKILKDMKPDAILHFTDPHYWQWLYDAEHEIRQQVPILYYHIWDNTPDPLFNRNFYESCDWVGCISKLTYGVVNRVSKLENNKTWKPLEDWQISYVPHGINSDIFKPEDITSPEIKNLVDGYDFVLFFNSRNIRRKQPADVIYSFKLFCDMLPKEKSDKCILIMHTTPIDNNGTDLYAVVDKICPDYRVELHGTKIEATLLNQLYNVADCTINIANNEGFGLSTAESLMAGTPIIVSVTGGLQDQCGFEYTADDYVKIETLSQTKFVDNLNHGDWVKPVWPAAININGSPLTPYIYDDRVNDYDVANAIFEFYNMGRDVRKEKGLKGREWALNNLSSKIMCDALINGIETTLEKFQPRKKYDLYKIV